MRRALMRLSSRLSYVCTRPCGRLLARCKETSNQCAVASPNIYDVTEQGEIVRQQHLAGDVPRVLAHCKIEECALLWIVGPKAPYILAVCATKSRLSGSDGVQQVPPGRPQWGPRGEFRPGVAGAVGITHQGPAERCKPKPAILTLAKDPNRSEGTK